MGWHAGARALDLNCLRRLRTSLSGGALRQGIEGWVSCHSKRGQRYTLDLKHDCNPACNDRFIGLSTTVSHGLRGT